MPHHVRVLPEVAGDLQGIVDFLVAQGESEESAQAIIDRISRPFLDLTYMPRRHPRWGWNASGAEELRYYVVLSWVVLFQIDETDLTRPEVIILGVRHYRSDVGVWDPTARLA